MKIMLSRNLPVIQRVRPNNRTVFHLLMKSVVTRTIISLAYSYNLIIDNKMKLVYLYLLTLYLILIQQMVDFDWYFMLKETFVCFCHIPNCDTQHFISCSNAKRCENVIHWIFLYLIMMKHQCTSALSP